MKYFLTGATGFIGLELTKHLLLEGETVHALVRSPDNPILPNHQNLVLFKGDVSDQKSIDRAMEGCDYVFHLAGYTKPWSKEKYLPYKINVEGTRGILESALKNKIKRVVFTSTAGTLKPSETDEEIDENSPAPEFYFTEYEQTKREAEKLCLSFVLNGLDVVIVNPSRVYGPGQLNKSNSVTLLIKKYIDGKWRFIPGNGKNIGNYVYIENIVEGHMLALKKGKRGERYILGGTNASFNELFGLLAEITERHYRLFNLPLWLMILFSKIMGVLAAGFGIEPLITTPWVKRYNQNRVLTSKKAKTNLGYSITPLSEGVKKTKVWLESKNN